MEWAQGNTKQLVQMCEFSQYPNSRTGGHDWILYVNYTIKFKRGHKNNKRYFIAQGRLNLKIYSKHMHKKLHVWLILPSGTQTILN